MGDPRRRRIKRGFSQGVGGDAATELSTQPKLHIGRTHEAGLGLRCVGVQFPRLCPRNRRNRTGYVENVQATCARSGGAVSSNPPPSCVLNPPAARTLVNPRLPTPGLVYIIGHRATLGPLRAGLNFLHSTHALESCVNLFGYTCRNAHGNMRRLLAANASLPDVRDSKERAGVRWTFIN